MDALADTPDRLQWMDLLRGLAVLLIISWHAVTVPLRFGVEMPEIILAVNTSLSPYRLPTLLVISGMLLPRSLSKPLNRYYEGKARNILWPYVIWTLITALTVNASEVLNPVVWYAGLDHLWFLSTLLVCYLVAPLLRPIPGWVVAGVLFGTWFLLSPQIPGVANWIWFGAYFFLGATLGQLGLARLPWWSAALLAVVSVGGVVAAMTGTGTGYAWKPHWVAISLAGVVLLIWIAPRIPRRRPVRVLESVGRASIYYYVAHVPAITLAATGLAALGLPGGWAAYIAMLAVGIAVPFVLTRVPGAHWLFAFGKRKVRDAR